MVFYWHLILPFIQKPERNPAGQNIPQQTAQASPDAAKALLAPGGILPACCPHDGPTIMVCEKILQPPQRGTRQARKTGT